MSRDSRQIKVGAECVSARKISTSGAPSRTWRRRRRGAQSYPRVLASCRGWQELFVGEVGLMAPSLSQSLNLVAAAGACGKISWIVIVDFIAMTRVRYCKWNGQKHKSNTTDTKRPQHQPYIFSNCCNYHPFLSLSREPVGWHREWLVLFSPTECFEMLGQTLNARTHGTISPAWLVPSLPAICK